MSFKTCIQSSEPCLQKPDTVMTLTDNDIMTKILILISGAVDSGYIILSL